MDEESKGFDLGEAIFAGLGNMFDGLEDDDADESVEDFVKQAGEYQEKSAEEGKRSVEEMTGLSTLSSDDLEDDEELKEFCSSTMKKGVSLSSALLTGSLESADSVREKDNEGDSGADEEEPDEFMDDEFDSLEELDSGVDMFADEEESAGSEEPFGADEDKEHSDLLRFLTLQDQEENMQESSAGVDSDQDDFLAALSSAGGINFGSEEPAVEESRDEDLEAEDIKAEETEIDETKAEKTNEFEFESLEESAEEEPADEEPADTEEEEPNLVENKQADTHNEKSGKAAGKAKLDVSEICKTDTKEGVTESSQDKEYKDKLIKEILVYSKKANKAILVSYDESIESLEKKSKYIKLYYAKCLKQLQAKQNKQIVKDQQSKPTEKKVTPNVQTTSVNEIDQYSDMSLERLYDVVKDYLIENGVKHSLVPVDKVVNKFGRANIKRLRDKNYIIVIRNGITLG